MCDGRWWGGGRGFGAKSHRNMDAWAVTAWVRYVGHDPATRITEATAHPDRGGQEVARGSKRVALGC